MTASLLGLSHLALSVTDVAAGVRFWTQVMGFELVSDNPRFAMLIDRDAHLGVIITDHEGSVTGPFDEKHVGLDHVAFAVADVDTLRAWEQRLTELDVPHTRIREVESGHHLNLRAPDNVPIELYAMSRKFLAEIGLAEPADAVARTYP